MPKGGCGIGRRSGKRARTKTFHGNQHITKKKKVNPARQTTASSASEKKLQSSSLKAGDHRFSGYRLIDCDFFFKKVKENFRCKCGSEVKFEETAILGLYSSFTVECSSCGIVCSIPTSTKVGVSNNAPEVNRRFQYALRCLGHGRSGMKTFCEVMDLPAPVKNRSYERIKAHIIDAQKYIANKSMTSAVDLEAKITGSNDISVSGDGSWNTRGHTALNGVNTGKVIDVEVKCKECRGCDAFKGPIDTPEFLVWEERHSLVCSRTHVGASGNMETEGIVDMFKRSETVRGCRYTEYIGDGDAKVHAALLAATPYGDDVIVDKVECVLHVQKRMGTRLRKRLKEKIKLGDNKGLGGKGRLTKVAVTRISGLYGKCIRDNHDSLDKMIAAVWALYDHTRSTDKDPHHDGCSVEWCKWVQEMAATGEVKEYSHKHRVDPLCMEAIKDIFVDLAHPTLLRRCLAGKNPNPNESFNSLVWKFCPKTDYAGLHTVKSAVYEAVVMFNDGHAGRLEVMKELGLVPGKNAIEAARQADEERLGAAARKSQDASKEARLARKQQRAKDAANDAAHSTYSAGAF